MHGRMLCCLKSLSLTNYVQIDADALPNRPSEPRVRFCLEYFRARIDSWIFVSGGSFTKILSVSYLLFLIGGFSLAGTVFSF